MAEVKPVLLGCKGIALTEEERALFSDLNPFGMILFQRNCENPEQLRALTQSLREAVGRADMPIFIDQEGGRVARLKPPHWPRYSSARVLGVLYEKDADLGREAVRLHAALTAQMLTSVGINGNCAPVMDLLFDGASPAIGDRAYSADPVIVAACAKCAVETYLTHGVFPVIKHLPGHGRVIVDPHIDLPFVEASLESLAELDFKPFMTFRDAPIAMNCHVVFRSLDPNLPVSLSHKVHEEVIRGRIGFDGLLFSDDLAMGALKMPLRERGMLALQAGADIVLYCTGEPAEAREVCAELPPMSEEAHRRWRQAQTSCCMTLPQMDVQSMQARLDELLGSSLTA